MNNAINSFRCYVCVDGGATNPADEGLAGVYMINVATSSPVALGSLTATEEHRIAEAVLDKFHSKQGIEVIEDFSISVFLENGVVVAENLGEPSAQLGFSVCADYCGSVGVKSLPEAVRRLL